METNTTKRKVEFLSPDGLHKNPAFSQVAVITGSVKTVYVGGQNAVSKDGQIIGKGDIKTQAEQTLKNLQTALQAGGATLDNVIKWNVYVVQGQSSQPAFQVFQKAMGNMSNPPLITLVYVSGLAHPDFLMEMDAVAIVPE